MSAERGSADRGEAIRLAGVIREIERAPMRRTVRVASQTQHAHDDGTIVVEIERDTGEGTTEQQLVRVDVPGKAIVDDGKVKTGAWSELAPLAKRFESSLAPAFSSAELETAELEVGDAIEIYGEVAKREFGEDGGMRDAPSQRVTAVRALIVATGKRAREAVTRELAIRYPPAKRPVERSGFAKLLARRAATVSKDPSSPHYRWSRYVYISELVALALTILLAVLGETRDYPWATAFAFWAGAHVVLARPTPATKAFRVHERQVGRHFDPEAASIAIPTLVFGLVVGGLTFMFSPFVFASIAVGAIAVGLMLGVLGMQTYAAHARILAAKRWDGSIGGFAAIEGVVKDPTPATLGNQRVAIGDSVGYSGKGSDTKEVWHRFHSDGTFLVETPQGVVEVSPDHVSWSTSVVGIQDKGVEGAADRLHYEVVPIGGRVIAAGWIERGTDSAIPQLRSKGRTPAYLVATGPQGDPRGWLARQRRHVLLTFALMVAYVGVYLWHYGLV